jgi:ATP/maltotriose-dependent transcriptional regulator MalT
LSTKIDSGLSFSPEKLHFAEKSAFSRKMVLYCDYDKNPYKILDERAVFIMTHVLEKNGTMPMQHTHDSYHLIRHRINVFLTNATTHSPVTIVCAGTGCGKTRAVADFLAQTAESGIIAYDDLHFGVPESVHHQIDDIISGKTPDAKLILIYRALPEELEEKVTQLNRKAMISQITEADLNFTMVELATCLKKQDLVFDDSTTREVLKDTAGWAFGVNLAVRSLKSVPQYEGFVKTRLKPNIFGFMESENWTNLSENMKHFLVGLSLSERHCEPLAADLASCAGDKEKLMKTLNSQDAFISYNKCEKVYSFHPLYLEFLQKKQSILAQDKKVEILDIISFHRNAFMRNG